MKNSRFRLYLILIAILIVSFLAAIVMHCLLPQYRWENEPFHSTVEAFGALIAIFMALMLLKREPDEGGGDLFLSLGFLSMGILDGFHAICSPGESFVFLHSIASLTGGFWFVLASTPASYGYLSKKAYHPWVPWVAASGSVLFGIWGLLLPETLPAMLYNKKFTTTAITINIIASALFLASAFRFMLNYQRLRSKELFAIVCMSLLFGLAELLYPHSSIWNGEWWLFHLLRLAAYILVLWFVIRQYLIVVFDLKKTISKNIRIEKLLKINKEKMLQEKGPFAAKILNDMITFVGVLDSMGNITFVNNTPLKIAELKMEDIKGKKLFDTFWFVYSDKVREIIKRDVEQCASGKSIVHDVQIQIANGSLIWIEFSMHPIYDAHGIVLYLIPEGRDITERKLAENELRKLSVAVQQSPVLIIITDLQGDIEYVNQKFCDLTGYSAKEVIGKNPRICQSGKIEKETYEQLWETILAGKEWRGELYNTKKNGELYWEDATISPILDEKGDITHFLAVKEDITQRRQIETRLQQAQKMEAIGTLAGGIAHDFNNILFPIIGFTEMMLDNAPEGSDLQENLKEVLTASLRASDLVKQILTFSSLKEKKIIPLKIQIIIKEILKLVKASLPSTINIKQHIDRDCAMVLADWTEIDQIAMNLITNAFHAMEENGGTLTIELSEVNITTEDSKSFDLNPGIFVLLSVSDTGHGIKKHILNRIFDPYFTTKDQGKGIGLGLSVAHGIVKNYEGNIRVHSESGKGAVFNVYLPAIHSTHKKKQTTMDHPLVQCKNRHILLVDDEEPILKLEKIMLENIGYRVTFRTSSMEALEAFRAQPDEFDLVVTDMTMPNMTGEKLALELKNIKQEIPVILCTGFSEKMSEEKAKSLGIDGFLIKPVTKKDLSQKIQILLNSKKGK